MTKKESVDRLITNGGFEERDRESLTAYSDEKLARLMGKLAPENPNPAPEAVANAAKDEGKGVSPPAPIVNNQGPVTWEELWKAAPGEVRESIGEAIEVRNQKKAQLVETIMANSANTFTKDELLAMKLKEVERIAVLAAPRESGRAPALNPSFLGASGAPIVNASDEDDLPLPAMEFAK